MDWVLIILGTQVIKKKKPVRPMFPDYLSVSYDYDGFKCLPKMTSVIKIKKQLDLFLTFKGPFSTRFYKQL